MNTSKELFFPTVAMAVHRRARWIPLTSAAVEVQTDTLLQPVIWGRSLVSCLFFFVKELSFVYIANLVPKGNEFGILTKILISNQMMLKFLNILWKEHF